MGWGAGSGDGGDASMTLTFVDGPLRGTRHTVSRSALAAAPGEECRIGREADADLSLLHSSSGLSIGIPTDRILSTRHCAIVLDTAGSRAGSNGGGSLGFAIKDLHSTNGTGIRLAPPREQSRGYPLTVTSLFGCGVTKFIVEAVELAS